MEKFVFKGKVAFLIQLNVFHNFCLIGHPSQRKESGCLFLFLRWPQDQSILALISRRYTVDCRHFESYFWSQTGYFSSIHAQKLSPVKTFHYLEVKKGIIIDYLWKIHIFWPKHHETWSILSFYEMVILTKFHDV